MTKEQKQIIVEKVKCINERDRFDNQIPLSVGYGIERHLPGIYRIFALNPTWNPSIEAFYYTKTKKLEMAY